MRLFKSIILLFLIGVAVIFTFQNLQTVELSFLKWYLKLPLSLISTIIYILGAITGSIVFSMLKKVLSENSSKSN